MLTMVTIVIRLNSEFEEYLKTNELPSALLVSVKSNCQLVLNRISAVKSTQSLFFARRFVINNSVCINHQGKVIVALKQYWLNIYQIDSSVLVTGSFIIVLV